MRKVITLKSKPRILSASSVVGEKEMNGPLGDLFDITRKDTKFDQSTWEQAESEMIREAYDIALKKADIKDEDIDAIFAGDLINQCTSTSFGLLEKDTPYFGIYGACSTYAEGIIAGSLALEAKAADRVACVTSSHYCSAERQFRFPLEYGCQRTPTAQYTVTGAAVTILDNMSAASDIYINQIMPGKICDYGIDDVNNMGAAMAPSAADTLIRYFNCENISPDSFDMILTGDLGYEGSEILKELMNRTGIKLANNYNDCGLLIYDRINQDVHAGGSGCACSGTVVNSLVMDKFNKGEINDVLIIGTGALLSPLTAMQGQSIPGIAHLIRITREK